MLALRSCLRKALAPRALATQPTFSLKESVLAKNKSKLQILVKNTQRHKSPSNAESAADFYRKFTDFHSINTFQSRCEWNELKGENYIKVCSSFATSPRQTEGTFYEFCTYYLKPSKMKEFLHNFKKRVHLRTAHSELVGYWSVGFGGITDRVFHIWKYDNFAHRTAVYKALANDKEWQEQFFIPNLTSIDKQETEIAYMVPWCKIGKPCKKGVYELVTFLMKPGGPALWGDAFERAVNARGNQGYATLIGVFHTEYGTLNRVHVLWWMENADVRAAGRHRSHDDSKVVSAVRESVNYLDIQQNMFLIPESFSPLK